MKKQISIFFIILLVVVLTLAVMKRVGWLTFYIVAGCSALVAWKIVPKMKD